LKTSTKDKLKVSIVTREALNFLVEIQWAQEEIIDVLDNALRNDTIELADLPDRGVGLAKALKVTNWAMEKIVNQVMAGEPCLNEILCDDKKAGAALQEIREEAELKLAKIMGGAA
jgi:hypothetical protein